MFNLKKIEPKFQNNNLDKIQRQFTYTNNKHDEFINFDVNISEEDFDILEPEKYKTINNEKLIKNDLLRIIPIKCKKKPQKNMKYKLFNDNNSTTTNCSDIKAIKKVTFSTVEIIRVAKYKKYNASNNFSKANIEKNIIEVKNEKKQQEFIPCFIF